ncbi:MAG: hypothetical protein ACR2MA_07305 [Egibacteraceae bacterium]
MASIDVTATGDGQYRVVVTEDGDASEHEVTVPKGYPQQIGVADVPTDEVVRASFLFLLEREPQEQIMARFELPVIGEYFPDYEEELPGLLDRG